MMVLVIGGSGSGKSAYAEQILSGITDVSRKYYLATMQVFDEDGRKKVENHKKNRQGRGFLTIEQPKRIAQAAEKMEAGENAVLLECMSNLAANEMFGEEILPASETAETVLSDIRKLQAGVKHLVIVTNNVFEDGIRYDDGTAEYIRALAELNRRLAEMADKVVEVIAGIPLVIKG